MFGVLRGLPWNRYSFLGRAAGSAGNAPNCLERPLLPGNKTLKDVLNLQRLIGLCSCDKNLVLSTNWAEIYLTLHESIARCGHLWRFRALVKVLQNSAYLAHTLTKAGMDVTFLRDPIRTIAARLGKEVGKVSNSDVPRVIYSCSRGDFLGHAFVPPSFILLFENELMQRLDHLDAVDLLKVVHSASALRRHGQSVFSTDFILCLLNKIVKKISQIGSIDISNLVCYLSNYRLLNEDNRRIINRNINRRLYAINDKDVLLTLFLSLSMYGVVNDKNLELISSKLESQLDQFKPQDILKLKLAGYYLKYNQQPGYSAGKSLPNLFNRVSSHFPNDVCYRSFHNLNHIEGGVNYLHNMKKLLRMLNYRFVPFIHGPYLLNFYDPINRVTLLPPLNRAANKGTEGPDRTDATSEGNDWVQRNLDLYYQNMVGHLEREGVRVVLLDHSFFQASIYHQVEHLIHQLRHHYYLLLPPTNNYC